MAQAMAGEQELDMTALTMAADQRRVPSSRPMLFRRTRVAIDRRRVDPVDFIATTASVLRPFLVTVAVLTAAMASSTPAHADPGSDPAGSALDNIGADGGNPISDAIAQVAQSFCPILVQPGSSLASSAAQASGHGGAAPPIAGFLAGMAIKAQCPGFMTSVANGNMPVPVSGMLPGGGN
jgi:hypothetical protein